VQPDSQTKLAHGNIPYHRHHVQFTNGSWPRGKNALFCEFEFSLLWESSAFWEFELFHEFGVLLWVWQVMRNSQVWRNPQNSWAPGNPQDPWSLRRDWLHNSSLGREKKIVLSIHWFAYSWLLSSLVLLVVVVVFSFIVSLYCLYLNPRVLPFIHSPPHPTV